jgi:hypothetical protein
MEDFRFDGWTRRRVGRASAGVAGVLAGLLALEEAAAGKRKRRRKRCRKLGRGCVSGGKQKCCGNLRCDRSRVGSSVLTCCKTEGKSCGGDPECCDNHFCEGVPPTCVFYPPPSDRNLKANFESVDPTHMLARVRELPISTWNYSSDDPAIRHIGPMAQDFAAIFGLGADDRRIHPIDGQGVAFAAIQGLVADLERLRVERGVLAARVSALEQSR